MPHPRRIIALSVLVIVTACVSTAAPIEEPTEDPTEDPDLAPAPLAVQEPLAGLPYDDARLVPVIAELRASPEWLDAPLEAEPVILALIPSTSEVCLAMRGPDGDIHVTIDASATRWSVAAVAIDRGDVGREFTFDPDGMASDVCTFVAFGRQPRWPVDASGIEVTGNAGRDVAGAIAEAVHARPDRFGIDAVGLPAVLVGDRIEPPPEGWTCSHAVVFVGGPRSEIVIGTRPTGSGWEVETRIVGGALIAPEPRRDGQC